MAYVTRNLGFGITCAVSYEHPRLPRMPHFSSGAIGTPARSPCAGIPRCCSSPDKRVRTLAATAQASICATAGSAPSRVRNSPRPGRSAVESDIRARPSCRLHASSRRIGEYSPRHVRNGVRLRETQAGGTFQLLDPVRDVVQVDHRDALGSGWIRAAELGGSKRRAEIRFIRCQPGRGRCQR